MRAVFIVLAIAFIASGCSNDKPVARETQASEEHTLQRDCADPKWKQQNLGLWYSVCRQPMHW